MTARTTRRSILHVRCSTGGQADGGLGLEAQTDRCRAYAKAFGYVPTRTVIDAGVSRTVAPGDRPGLGASSTPSTPTGRFAFTALAVVAQLERDQPSERTRGALLYAERKVSGWGDRHRSHLRPPSAPWSYVHRVRRGVWCGRRWARRGSVLLKATLSGHTLRLARRDDCQRRR